jgi:hypothetical protein
MMEHPGVNINDVKKLSLEEVQDKIRELYERLTFAYSMGNQELINQIEMVLTVYRRAQQELLNEMFGDDGDGPDLSDKIDVS